MKLVTYLAPGIPLGFHGLLAEAIGAALGCDVTMSSDPRQSGPPADEPNPLTTGAADGAFLCGPSYLRLRDEVRLVPVAPVFADPRGAGRPVYFAEVVVRADDQAPSLAALTGHRLAYNDPTSLSGRLALLAALGGRGRPAGDVRSGTGEAALEHVAGGAADVCSIDSVVWRRLATTRPRLVARLRVLTSLGPYPVQPMVVARHVPRATVATIAAALRAIEPAVLAPHGATGFAPVAPSDYEPLRTLLTRAAGAASGAAQPRPRALAATRPR